MYHRDHLYIGGTWVASADQRRLPVENPATEQIIGYVPDGSAADMAKAVEAARAAFDEGPWPRMDPGERADMLLALADGLERRSAELASLITAETGLPISLVSLVHTRGPVRALRRSAELAKATAFERAQRGAIFPFRVRQVPVGVVGAIVPWNIPMLAAGAKLGPALAAGCTTVLKPSPETPLSAFLLADAADEIGLPPGVFNLVPADRDAGAALVAHPGIDKITFTGSTAAGKAIAQVCARAVKRYSLELGGNAAAVILDDAPLEQAADSVVGMSLANNNGEACIVQGRVLVPRARAGEFVEAIVAAAKKIVVGDPTDPATRLGPMVSRTHRDRVLGYVELGRREGARLVHGGGRPAGLDRGWYVEPTVFADAHNGMRVVREEIFGPVVTVIPYDSLDEAVAIANDTEYGLSGSVWSADLARSAEIASRIRAGTMFLNGAFMLDVDAPFGGFKESGVGREGGPDALGEFLEPQVMFVPELTG